MLTQVLVELFLLLLCVRTSASTASLPKGSPPVRSSRPVAGTRSKRRREPSTLRPPWSPETLCWRSWSHLPGNCQHPPHLPPLFSHFLCVIHPLDSLLHPVWWHHVHYWTRPPPLTAFTSPKILNLLLLTAASTRISRSDNTTRYYGLTRVRHGLSGYVRGRPGSCRVLQGTSGSVRVLQVTSGSVQVLQGLSGSCRVRQGPSGVTWILQDTAGSHRSELE